MPEVYDQGPRPRRKKDPDLSKVAKEAVRSYLKAFTDFIPDALGKPIQGRAGLGRQMVARYLNEIVKQPSAVWQNNDPLAESDEDPDFPRYYGIGDIEEASLYGPVFPESPEGDIRDIKHETDLGDLQSWEGFQGYSNLLRAKWNLNQEQQEQMRPLLRLVFDEEDLERIKKVPEFPPDMPFSGAPGTFLGGLPELAPYELPRKQGPEVLNSAPVEGLGPIPGFGIFQNPEVSPGFAPPMDLGNLPGFAPRLPEDKLPGFAPAPPQERLPGFAPYKPDSGVMASKGIERNQAGKPKPNPKDWKFSRVDVGLGDHDTVVAEYEINAMGKGPQDGPQYSGELMFHWDTKNPNEVYVDSFEVHDPGDEMEGNMEKPDFNNIMGPSGVMRVIKEVILKENPGAQVITGAAINSGAVYNQGRPPLSEVVSDYFFGEGPARKMNIRIPERMQTGQLQLQNATDDWYWFLDWNKKQQQSQHPQGDLTEWLQTLLDEDDGGYEQQTFFPSL